MARVVLSDTDKHYIALEYSSEQVTQQDLADLYGVSRTTIRRVLAKKGLCIYTHPK